MKFSKSWLQEYIIETLPENEVIADALNKKVFEVEEVITLPDDTVFDIKVLPNRAHDALGHHGMAYELCATLALTFNKAKDVVESKEYFDHKVKPVAVAIDDAKACTRFMAVRMDHVCVQESPSYIKARLEALGERSINSIVDVTNYVQFALNKPMHAYDARSVKGTLRARFAKKGETLTTLDDKELILDEETLVIADDEKVLGLAGIKGGKWSGIKEDTTSVILESANFNPVLIRKTAEKYGIKTQASKRFENGIANNLVVEGLHMTANMLHELYGQARKGEVTDIYPKKDTSYYVGISRRELNDILGASYTDDIIRKTLETLSFPYEMLIPSQYIHTEAKNVLGAGYKNPSSMREDAPHAFSCSSLVSYLYRGVWLPSLSIDKYVFTKKVTKHDLRFGDLIFANSGEGVIRHETVEFMRGTHVKEGVDHVGMYIGNDTVLHATKVKGMVVEESLEDFSSTRSIVGYGRVLDDLEEPRYVVRVPSVRLDVRTKEDLAEEIGRIIGYNTLVPILPSLGTSGGIHKRGYYEGLVRKILLTHGYSEVLTYSFGNKGEVALVKGLAEDKEKLRTNLSDGLIEAYTKNYYNAPLLGEKVLRMFEFGSVFTKKGEEKKLALIVDDGAKKSSFVEEVEKVMKEVKHALGLTTVTPNVTSTKPYCVELDFGKLVKDLPTPTSMDAYPVLTSSLVAYSSISPYPFIVRDIAVWVPESLTFDELLVSINEVLVDDMKLLAKPVALFDSFTKEGRTSYAFRIILQSQEKTLTDEEANGVAGKVYDMLKKKGYEVR